MSEPIEEFEHNGKTVRIFVDDDGENANPRQDDGNIATIIQENRGYLDIDTDDAGLAEARERFDGYGKHGWSKPTWGIGEHSSRDREEMVKRYIAIFRPDILFYEDRCYPSRDSQGWGYVTRENWEKAMGEDYSGEMTPERAFAQEVETYRQWADGEVYGYTVEGDDGTEDSCWGFLGWEFVLQSARDAAGYTCKHCGMAIMRWVGPVLDTGPGDFVHQCCKTCKGDVEWGGDGWYHNTVKPWDWPDGKPDHIAEISHRHACALYAETDQEVGKYTE